ncbi:hypothetical protein LBBP_00015 [Leptospira borgpetersenii serovar Ballum]|uniref:Uncharacterized protein n=1 Tax=Leptospira borgpetersenii serovar Ballum TaxID=280505 RepID=A0A0S2ILB5_LEPBO|nr:hypothetical protein LBBP_00015 [Leptospira borgpetersenii serovar Ballum]
MEKIFKRKLSVKINQTTAGCWYRFLGKGRRIHSVRVIIDVKIFTANRFHSLYFSAYTSRTYVSQSLVRKRNPLDSGTDIHILIFGELILYFK